MLILLLVSKSKVSILELKVFNIGTSVDPNKFHIILKVIEQIIGFLIGGDAYGCFTLKLINFV